MIEGRVKSKSVRYQSLIYSKTQYKAKIKNHIKKLEESNEEDENKFNKNMKQS